LAIGIDDAREADRPAADRGEDVADQRFAVAR
jgi:hypothetical protein